MVSGVSISACSTRCRAARTRAQADLLGGGPDALDDGADGGVADGVEAGLEPRLGARGDVGGDVGGVQVGGAGVRGVGVGGVQAGGVGAERAVHEEVAGRADRAEFADAVGVLGAGDALGPVAEDPRARLRAGQGEQRGEVVLVGDVGPAALVDGADAERGGVRAARRAGPRRAGRA